MIVIKMVKYLFCTFLFRNVNPDGIKKKKIPSMSVNTKTLILGCLRFYGHPIKKKKHNRLF